MARYVRLVAASVGLTALAIACLHIGDPESPGSWTTEDATKFEGFSLYWLGESYRGLPLTSIWRLEPSVAGSPDDAVRFNYGTCSPEDRPLGGDCAYPLSVKVEPCGKAAVRLSGSSTSTRIRGAPAFGYHASEVLIWSRDVTITVTVSDPLYRANAPAEQLRLVSEGPEGAAKPLQGPEPTCLPQGSQWPITR